MKNGLSHTHIVRFIGKKNPKNVSSRHASDFFPKSLTHPFFGYSLKTFYYRANCSFRFYCCGQITYPSLAYEAFSSLGIRSPGKTWKNRFKCTHPLETRTSGMEAFSFLIPCNAPGKTFNWWTCPKLSPGGHKFQTSVPVLPFYRGFQLAPPSDESNLAIEVRASERG